MPHSENLAELGVTRSADRDLGSVLQQGGRLSRRCSTERPPGACGRLARTYDATIGQIPFDPFEMLQLVGKAEMRVRLRALTRAELLAMIGEYGLNPAAKSLVRLSDSQLVTFIVTAVEVQSARGNPAGN